MSELSDAQDHRLACVNRVPIFRGLTETDRRQVAAIAVTRPYERREQVYGPGDEPGLLIVHRGRLKVYRLSEAGAEQVVRFLEPGEFLGETAVLADRPIDHFAEATEAAEVCSIRRSALRGLLSRQPDVALRMLRTVSGRLETAEQLLSAVTGQSVEQRLAEHLLRRAAEEGSNTFRLQSSKRDLASFLGTTPETLSRRFAALQDAGLVRSGAGRAVQILDDDGLRALLALDPRA